MYPIQIRVGFGIAVSGVLDSTDVQDLMKASGAFFPLRDIMDVGYSL